MISVAAISTLLALAACDEQQAPASATGNANPIGKLAETPTSLPGRSADQGRKLVGAIGKEQDEASNLANEISGQAGTVTAGGLNFAVPESWEKQIPDPAKFQTALFKLAGDEGNGETIVVFFGSIRGNVESNVERWRGMVSKPDGQKADAKVTTNTVEGLPVTMVSIDGKYTGMTSSATIADAGFRAALIEVMPGQMVCLRLTGPRDTVEGRTQEFWSVVKGFKK